MKTRVIHKGLLLVALPLLVELSIISSLWFILNTTDKEQEEVTKSCQRSSAAGRLIFADFKLAYGLMEAWSQQNLSKLDDAEKSLAQVRSILLEMQNLPTISDANLAQLHLKSMQAQTHLADDFDLLCKLSKEGNLQSVNSIIHKQKDLIDDLRESFVAVGNVHDRIELSLKKRRKHLIELNQQLLIVLAAGIVINLLAAIWLSAFFRRQFTQRIAKINQNAKLLAEGKPTLARQAGTDEISDFDDAFHNMREQLELAASRELAIFENSADLICILSQELRFVRVNKACTDLFGRGPEELTGKLLKDFQDNNDQFDKTEKQLLEGRSTEKSLQFELTLVRPDGSSTESKWSARYSRSQRLWYCTAHDITEQRNIERLKNTFMLLLSSDFQLPLKQISNSFNSLLSDFAAIPDTAAAKIRSSISTLNRLLSLVDKLLYVDRIDSREKKLERRTCNAAELIKIAVADLHESAINKKLDIECEIQNPELTCYAEEQSIVRVLVNLLSNAIKFSPAKSKIIISAEQLVETVKFKITDQGSGIPADLISRLFQAYQQSSVEDGKRGQGTGLGLLICKQEVELHGGRIGVDSESGKGSTFWFEIPHLNRQAQCQSAPLQDTSIRPGSASGSPAGKTSIQTSDLPANTVSVAPINKGIVASVQLHPLGSRVSLSQKLKILVGIPLIFELFFVGVMTVLMLKSSAELDLQFRQLDLLSETATLNTHLYEIAFNTLPIKRKEKTLEQWKKEAQKLDKQFSEFEARARNDSVGAVYVARLKVLIDEFKNELLNLRPVPTDSASAKDNTIMKSTFAASVELNHLIRYLNLRQVQTPEIRKATRQIETAILILGLISNVALAALLSIFFSLDISHRFMLLADNSNKLAAGLPLNPRALGTDEIAQLDETFHEMAIQLKETREKESAFLDNSQEIIFSTDQDGKVTAINNAVEVLLNVSPNSVKNTSISRLVKEADRKVLDEEFELCKKHNQTRKAELCLINPHTKHTIEALVSLSWSETEQAFFCIAHDISKQKEVDQIRREFISVITHDLRSPLSAIVFSARVLEAGAYGEMPTICLPIIESICTECFRVVELINDLLDLEKLGAGQMKLEKVDISLQELIAKTLECLDKAQLAENIETPKLLDIEAIPAILRIAGDRERLARALSEVLRQTSLLESDSSKLKCFAKNEKVVVEITCTGSHNNKESTRKTIDLLSKRLELDLDQNNKGRLRIPLALRILDAHAALVFTEIQENGDLRVSIQFPSA